MIIKFYCDLAPGLTLSNVMAHAVGDTVPPNKPGAPFQRYFFEVNFPTEGIELMDDISAEPSWETCKKCGSNLFGGLCSDETCPYSDRKQDETFTEG